MILDLVSQPIHASVFAGFFNIPAQSSCEKLERRFGACRRLRTDDGLPGSNADSPNGKALSRFATEGLCCLAHFRPIRGFGVWGLLILPPSFCSTLSFQDFPLPRPASPSLNLNLQMRILDTGHIFETCNLQMRILHPGRLSRGISTSYGSIRMIPNKDIDIRTTSRYSVLCLSSSTLVDRLIFSRA